MPDSNLVVEKQLNERLNQVAGIMSADVLAFCGPIYDGVDDEIRGVVEGISDKKNKLAVMIETPGGYIETAKRIVDTFRHHYDVVDFIVANHAMSAGTVLVMSGDAIYMDYYSVLGPIDPQIERPDGNLVPGLGYLIQYERLIERSAKKILTTAELHYLVERFDPAELYSYEQARELSITLLKKWLVQYKFKNWKKTETRQIPVTTAMKTSRAAAIAKKLNDTDFWHSHGHGISMDVLRRDMKLQIEDFGLNPPLNTAVRAYYRLVTDYMQKRGLKIAVHARDNFDLL